MRKEFNTIEEISKEFNTELNYSDESFIRNYTNLKIGHDTVERLKEFFRVYRDRLNESNTLEQFIKELKRLLPEDITVKKERLSHGRSEEIIKFYFNPFIHNLWTKNVKQELLRNFVLKINREADTKKTKLPSGRNFIDEGIETFLNEKSFFYTEKEFNRVRKSESYIRLNELGILF